MIICFNKRGVAHFEMIVSFIFFMSFVLFLFAILTPYSDSNISETVNDRLRLELADEAHANYSSFFLKAEIDPSTDCLSINLASDSFEYKFTNVNVTDINGNSVESDLYDLSTSGVLKINDPLDKEDYFVSFSSEFENNGFSGSNCLNPVSSVKGSITEKRVISYSKLKDEIKPMYGSDYEKLRDKLKVPKVFDFAIVSFDIPELSMDSKLIPDSADVYAKDYIFEVLKKDGSITNARFTIKIW